MLFDIELSVFPNPSAGKVTVLSDLEIIQINLYAADGKLMSIHELTIIDIDRQGIYFVKIFTEKGSVVKKIIIE